MTFEKSVWKLTSQGTTGLPLEQRIKRYSEKIVGIKRMLVMTDHELQRAELRSSCPRYLSQIKRYLKHCREQGWLQRLRLRVVTELTRL